MGEGVGMGRGRWCEGGGGEDWGRKLYVPTSGASTSTFLMETAFFGGLGACGMAVMRAKRRERMRRVSVWRCIL